MKKLIGILLALLLVTLPLSGLAATPDHFSIGVACFSLQAEFPATINETIHSYIKELGLEDKVEIISVDAQADAATQVGQVDNLIAQGVAGIILLPMDAVSGGDKMKKNGAEKMS